MLVIVTLSSFKNSQNNMSLLLITKTLCSIVFEFSCQGYNRTEMGDGEICNIVPEELEFPYNGRNKQVTQKTGYFHTSLLYILLLLYVLTL